MLSGKSVVIGAHGPWPVVASLVVLKRTLVAQKRDVVDRKNRHITICLNWLGEFQNTSKVGLVRRARARPETSSKLRTAVRLAPESKTG